MNTSNLRPNPFVKQRRSQRIFPLCFSGKHANGAPFVELTNTLVVSAHGALLHLRERVREGQPLNLRNVTTGEEIACVVIDVGTGSNGVPEVGVEFERASSRFWRVSFPPLDWNPCNAEARRFASGRGTARAVPPVKAAAPKK